MAYFMQAVYTAEREAPMPTEWVGSLEIVSGVPPGYGQGMSKKLVVLLERGS
jgi:hypothetical protein